MFLLLLNGTISGLESFRHLWDLCFVRVMTLHSEPTYNALYGELIYWIINYFYAEYAYKRNSLYSELKYFVA